MAEVVGVTGAQQLDQLLQKLCAPEAVTPLLSPLMRQALQMRLEPSMAARRVGLVVAAEPAMAERVVQIASTRCFSSGQPVYDLRQAITCLGNPAVANILDLLVMSRFMRHRAPAAHRTLREVWRNTLFTALAAREIASRRAADGEDAFQAGMFHNVGEPILVRQLADALPGNPRTFADGSVVFASIRYSHAETGAMFLSRWSFPGHIVALAANHHHHHEQVTDELHATINAAWELAHDRGYGCLEQEADAERYDHALKTLAMTRDEAAFIARTVESAMASLPASLR